MKNKKVVFIIIIVFIILLTATYFQNPKLLDRALYRVGIQEQVCFSENIVSNLEGAKNIDYILRLTLYHMLPLIQA